MFLGKEEREAAQILSDALARDDVEIHPNTRVINVRVEGRRKVVDLVSDDNKRTVAVDEILIGIGTVPNVEGMNLQAAGVKYDSEAGIPTNDFLQTTNCSGIGLRALARVNQPYPTQANAIKMAADAYNRTRLSPVRKWLFKQWLAW